MNGYHIITYGCQMNVHESEKIAGVLEDCGYIPAADREAADIIVLNTCCIRETAESKVFGNLGYIKKLKEAKPSLIVAVCGCMSQKDGTAEKLKSRCPFVDIIIGTHNIHLLKEYLEKKKTSRQIVEILESDGNIAENIPAKRTDGINAWVNIMYGCDNFCSYCIVPYVRGRERSRAPENIIGEVRSLLYLGYKEITLLGQNVNSYDRVGMDFCRLLEKLGSLDGKFRLSFMTSHPKDLSEDVIKVIKNSPNISRFIHVPAQSGSDKILKLMNRKYTSGEYLEKIGMIRKHIPDAGISGDIMVGFPREDDKDFEDTLALVKAVRYNNLFTFIYSRRSGTEADKMDGQIDIKTKRERIKRLIDTQADIAKELAGHYIGKECEVLCDFFEENTARGKTACGKTVTFDSSKNPYGKFVNVKITKSKNSNLFGNELL